MDVLVAYDIADTEGAGRRRLQRIAAVCSSFGTRVQLSVFECRVSPERYTRMVGEILDVIEPSQDSVLIYRFDGSIKANCTRLGRAGVREIDEPWIF